MSQVQLQKQQQQRKAQYVLKINLCQLQLPFFFSTPQQILATMETVRATTNFFLIIYGLM